MALSGANNAEKIWNRLISEGFSECGAAGLMGNLYAESALNPKNLQNTYEKNWDTRTMRTRQPWIMAAMEIL